MDESFIRSEIKSINKSLSSILEAMEPCVATIDSDTLKKVIREFAQKEGLSALEEILGDYGYDKFSDIPIFFYTKLYKILKDLL